MYDSPAIAELLLADQTSQSRKEKKFDYIPLQIILFLHMMDDSEEKEDKTTQTLRQCLLLMLNQKK